MNFSKSANPGLKFSFLIQYMLQVLLAYFSRQELSTADQTAESWLAPIRENPFLKWDRGEAQMVERRPSPIALPQVRFQSFLHMPFRV